MSHSSSKQKVIIFIDDEKICHVLAELIIPNFTDYKLVGAFNGKDAIMLAKRYSKELSLVLSDIMLPDMNGYKIHKALKEDPKLAHVPFIFQSGLEDGEEELRKNLNDSAKIIYKPYKQEELLNLIQDNAL